jgi:hypothetical protein
VGRAKGEGKWAPIGSKYFMCMYENRIMKPIKKCLKKGGWS